MQRILGPDAQALLVIVTHNWQKLSSVEREFPLIVMDFWQPFSVLHHLSC